MEKQEALERSRDHCRMDSISDYEEPDDSEMIYGNLNFAENEVPQPQSARRCSGRLPRVSTEHLQLLTSLGLLVLFVTILVQVTRIHQSLQVQTGGPSKEEIVDEDQDSSGSGMRTVEAPRKEIQADLYAIRQQLTQMRVTLERLCHSCPSIWTEFKGSCYLFFRSKRTWNNALLACQHVNALLVIINNEAEEKFLQSWQVRNRKDTWIGLSDLHQEGSWRWVDNTPLRSSFWNKGKPNNQSNEGCVEMQDDGWNDISCNLRRMWICEKPSTPCLKY